MQPEALESSESGIQDGVVEACQPRPPLTSPVKLQRRRIRKEPRERRIAELIQQDKEKDDQMVAAAI
ncbi:hypothetical protein MLD38_013620 [Melastoma candidum]|uniref:Uncharacterized protein n=1 Tax=Melastoma candidum TaxID=119954 RepID=A0ACB9RAA0_9MYRT|nr:hypothetical protein MLD38_013620 [Melastoma candidum]